MKYKDQLNTEEWKNKREFIIKRDNYTCCLCGYHGLLLNVHHIEYLPNKMAWEYSNDLLFTVCKGCHKTIHNSDIISKRINNTQVGSLIRTFLIYKN